VWPCGCAGHFNKDINGVRDYGVRVISNT